MQPWKSLALIAVKNL